MSAPAAIVGAFEHPTRKAPGVHPFELHAQVVRAALADAGLTLADVDGLCVAAGFTETEGGRQMSAPEVAEYLQLEPSFLDATEVGGCSSVVHVGHALAAIAAGHAEVVVVTYAATPRTRHRDSFYLTDELSSGQFENPLGATLIANFAMTAQRHMHEYGTTPEQLAAVVTTSRRYGSLNPHARHRDLLTVQDVLDSPYMATPIHRLECCVVTDGAGAVVVASADRARRCDRAPIWITGFGEATTAVSRTQAPALTVSPAVRSGRQAFERAGVGPEDVDVAQLYDAFSITVLLALEDLGLCPKGESGAFVASGAIGPDGAIPVNTDGGGISSNHPGKRGAFTVIESVRQLRGEGAGHQVPGARVALAHGIGWFSNSATLVLQV